MTPKAENCKTFIRRFDSDPRLQSNQVDPTACKPLPCSSAAEQIDEHKAKRGGVPGQNPDANISGPERFACDPFKHDWREVYYGYECRKCGCFVAFGCEPWVTEDDYDSEDYDE